MCWIVPRIGELRPQLEATVSRLAGIAIRIESISAYSNNLLPAFELGNVRLLDEQGREALLLPTVLVSLSPRSLLALKFDQILNRQPGAQRAPHPGWARSWWPGWICQSVARPTSTCWTGFFSQPEFVIRNGSVVWTDELRDVAAAWPCATLTWCCANRARTMICGWTPRRRRNGATVFSVTARFEQPFLSRGNGRWEEWWGQVYADFSRVDVAQLKKYAHVGVEVDQGRGAVRAWVDVQRAQVISATADVVLAGVSVRVDPTLAPLRLASLSGRLGAKFVADGFEFADPGPGL